MSHFRSLAFATIAAAMAASSVQAAEWRKFDRAAFKTALEEKKPVLVDVRAWWCPVCASQGATIRKAIASPQFDKLIVFEINYDRQETEWQSFGVHRQATLIAFRDGQEIGRLEYVTDKTKINALLTQTVN